MEDQPVSNADALIASLRLLGEAPASGDSEPVRRALHALDGSLAYDISGSLPGPDRPTWAAFNRLERENRLLTDHAEMLACALGACPNCWGSIPDCEDCGGAGHPGAFSPDRKCFDHFVLPVIARVLGRDPVERESAIVDRHDTESPASSVL